MTRKCSLPPVFGFEVGKGINGNANASREKAGNNYIRARQIASTLLKFAGYVPLIGAVVGVGRIADMVFIHKTGEYKLPRHLMAGRFTRATLEIAGVAAVLLPFDAACTVFRVVFIKRFNMGDAIDSDDALFVKWALKDRKLDPNTPLPGSRESPLHIAIARAVSSNHLDVLITLLGDRRIDPNLALYLALDRKNVNVNVVRAILENSAADPNNPYENPNSPFQVERPTPLGLATRSGSPDLVSALLENQRFNPQTARYCLHNFARSGEEDMLRVFLEDIRFDPNVKNGDGETPLCVAAGAGKGGIVEILLENERVHPDIACNGHLPLDKAFQNQHMESIKLLLKKGQKVQPDILKYFIDGLGLRMLLDPYVEETSGESRHLLFLSEFFTFCLRESAEKVMEDVDLDNYKVTFERLSTELEKKKDEAPDDPSRTNAEIRLNSIRALCQIFQPPAIKSANTI